MIITMVSLSKFVHFFFYMTLVKLQTIEITFSDVLIVGPDDTYRDIFESATFFFGFAFRLRRYIARLRNFLNSISRVELFEYAKNPEKYGRSNPDIRFLIR